MSPSPASSASPSDEAPSDFIRDIVQADLAAGRHQSIVTRFPPEPNGYLHIGHAKAICLSFGIAREFGGRCNLRFDDTNPTKEEAEYVESIQRDVEWLIAGWADHCLGLKPKGQTPITREIAGRRDFYQPPAPPDAAEVEPFFASDYFEQLYEFACELIRKGKAYVCDLTPEETDAYRGAPDRPGRESPYRNRSVEENLDLFARMKAGEFPDGARTLRARIDMASPNVWLRDPLLYRIRHATHHHTGDQWCIYPLYDFTHCLSDYLEGITHSLCTLEFSVHRALYDWVLENLDLPRPRPHQYEFAKLIPGYMIVSKRRLIQLVNEGVVRGWDDPRLPTLAGLRRRGIPASALRTFCERIGVTRYESVTDIALLEHTVRADLNPRAPRRLGVLRPLKVVLTNLPEAHEETVAATNNPEDPDAGTRPVPFTRELFIERDDFMEDPPKKFFRLRPGGEVRLKYAYIIRCDEVIKDAEGRVIELRCTADLGSKRGGPTAGRRVKGTLHWVSARHAVEAEVRLYDRLFTAEQPGGEDGDFMRDLNPNSLEIVTAKLEPALAGLPPETACQFERRGYFCLDPDTRPGHLVFNRILPLRDSWARLAKKG